MLREKDNTEVAAPSSAAGTSLCAPSGEGGARRGETLLGPGGTMSRWRWRRSSGHRRTPSGRASWLPRTSSRRAGHPNPPPALTHAIAAHPGVPRPSRVRLRWRTTSLPPEPVRQCPRPGSSGSARPGHGTTPSCPYRHSRGRSPRPCRTQCRTASAEACRAVLVRTPPPRCDAERDVRGQGNGRVSGPSAGASPPAAARVSRAARPRRHPHQGRP